MPVDACDPLGFRVVAVVSVKSVSLSIFGSHLESCVVPKMEMRTKLHMLKLEMVFINYSNNTRSL